MGIALILGGIGTRASHMRVAMKTYERLGFAPVFMPAPFPSAKMYILNAYEKRAKELSRPIESSPYLIHAVSGAAWTAAAIHRHVPATGVIFEAAPLTTSTENLRQTISKTSNLPLIPKKVMVATMRTLGIPCDEDGAQYKLWEHTFLSDLSTVPTMALVNSNDPFLSVEYVDSIVDRVCWFDSNKHVPVCTDATEMKYTTEIGNFVHTL